MPPKPRAPRPQMLPSAGEVRASVERSRDVIAHPVISSATEVNFRVPLDRWIETASLYVSLPAIIASGTPALPMFAGAEGLIVRSVCKLAGKPLVEAVGHGPRTTLIRALTRPAETYSSNAALIGYGGAPVQIDSQPDLLVEGTPGFGDHILRQNAAYSAGIDFGRLEAISAFTEAPFKQPWDDSSGYLEACTASVSTTAAGAVYLRNIHPELAALPVLPKIAGGSLEITITIDPSLATDATLTAGTATCAVSGATLCYSALELAPQMDKELTDVFESGSLALPYLAWVQSTAALPAKGAGADTQAIPLGFNDELATAVMVAARDATLTDAQKSVLRGARAVAFQPTASIAIDVAGSRLLSRSTTDSGARAACLAEALDAAAICPPPGSYETPVSILDADAGRKGHVVYAASMISGTNGVNGLASKLMNQIAPVGFDLRALPYLPRSAQNAMPTGADGIRLRLERPAGGSTVQQAAASLYAWAQVARVLRFPKTPSGLAVRVDKA